MAGLRLLFQVVQGIVGRLFFRLVLVLFIQRGNRRTYRVNLRISHIRRVGVKSQLILAAGVFVRGGPIQRLVIMVSC